ncbi:monooxygenase flavin-binding family protein-like protein [Phyllosticta citribraziliensis]|uniref:Monooxygenase flavin-binding family protein-like protein n=1 Tax=Phyllosticta citribraziliensis TaxID=989973 RepID=A0ABR1MC79_9PEZI
MPNETMEKDTRTDYDVIIVGAGIAGINGAYRVQTQLPEGTSYAILESRDAIGGTWDLFKYPGIRSDSDLHTFGFPWRPWKEQRAIADGESIVKYIRESAAMYGIDQKIKFRHKLLAADWRSELQRWRLSVEHNGEKKTLTSRFLFMGTGYYDYQEPLEVTIPGLENFKGTIVHPQFWPEDLDYTGKKVVVIGSGATAITLLPSLADKASHVAMLQRSPSYLLSLPSASPVEKLISWILPAAIGTKLLRWRWLFIGWFFFNFCRAFPRAARAILRLRTQSMLPKNVPHDPHFVPPYNPWEQRMCVCPDADFFDALASGKTSIATGHIKTVTADGIQLTDPAAQKLNPRITSGVDIIVTATGLKILLAGGTRLSVDGTPIDAGSKFLWRGLMLQDVPNAAFVIGYTNASWTLGADATAQLFTRIVNHMAAEGIASCVPTLPPHDAASMEKRPTLNLNSTYVKKAMDALPMTGDRGPWVARSSYYRDFWNAKFGDFRDGLLFRRAASA